MSSRSLVTQAERGDSGPAVKVADDMAEIGAAAAPGAGADVWLVRYDPRVVMISVKRGENGGKTLPHRNVVRQLVRLGRWSGRAVRFALPPSGEAELRTAILVQTSGAGPVLAAARG